MIKRYFKISALMAILVLMLTGCGGNFPELTPEEEQLIGEYAANILLKYDANNRSRLVSREEVEARKIELSQKEVETGEVAPPVRMDPVEDTPIIEVGEETQEAGSIDIGSFEDFYELPENVKITYQGNEIRDSYPGGETNAYFALDASEGKELLVLKFCIENQSTADQKIDLLSSETSIRAIVNDSRYNVLTTMLMDDMSTYIGEIPAGGVVDAVLMAEIEKDAGANISTLRIQLKNESKTCTIQLQ